MLSKKTGFLVIPFFFIFTSILSSNTYDNCKLSLNQNEPKNFKFTVQSGRIAFLCKTEKNNFFLRGTVTRTFKFQKTNQLFESMANDLKAQNIEQWETGRLYMIEGKRGGAQKAARLLCGFQTREEYSLEICAGEDNKDTSALQNFLKSILIDFSTIAPEKAPLLQSAALSTSKRVFTEENETKEPALLALTLPPGYSEVTRKENRAVFSDSTGLTESEIFYELSDLALDSQLAQEVYQSAIVAFLQKQGNWIQDEAEIKTGIAEIKCLKFSNGQKHSSYCYTVVTRDKIKSKKFCRLVFVIAYPETGIDQTILLQHQLKQLTAWRQMILKH